MNIKKNYHLIVIGSGAAGMISAITASKLGKNVLLLEKLPKLGAKLKATGGGKCNLTNTLSNEDFMASFGRNGRFISPSLEKFNQEDLRKFFKELGVESHAPDGKRVFPVTHNSDTIVDALVKEMANLGIDVITSQRVQKILVDNNQLKGVMTQDSSYYAKNVIVATGGLGYQSLGADGDGYKLASSVGHKVTSLYPAMMPLKTKERWVAECRADTISKVTMKIDLKKARKLKAVGDLIFTKDGIRGPVVLDFAREITPYLEREAKVPCLVNLTKGMNEEQIREHLKKDKNISIVKSISKLVPMAVGVEFCKLCEIEADEKFTKVQGVKRDKLIKMLAWTPLTVVGCEGFKKAMITRGGISLKEINPNTMESKLLKGLYFCGEVVDLDGPCGGFNLQWSFSSGFLAGHLG